MGVTLPAEMQGAMVTASHSVGVQKDGKGVEAFPAMAGRRARAESITMLLASGAGGIDAAAAAAGIQAMDERAQGGNHPLAAQIGQQLQGLGLNAPAQAGGNITPSAVPAPQKGPGREV